MVRRISRDCGLLAVAVLWVPGSGGVRADLPVAPGPDEGGTPVTLLDWHYEDDRDVLLALGELAFKSTAILSGNFSCDSCHPDGGTTSMLFYPGLSNKPGTIDMTNRALTMFEDGVFNPVNIPSLAGNRHTAPFGRHGHFETVEDFTRFAIVAEFAGSAPTELMPEAMAAFPGSRALPTNPLIDEAGRLTASAPDTARRGERIFRRPFPDSPAMSCATCHQPRNAFVDHRRHDVGTGGAIDTPTLRGVAASPPICMTAVSTPSPRRSAISSIASCPASMRRSGASSSPI